MGAPRYSSGIVAGLPTTMQVAPGQSHACSGRTRVPTQPETQGDSLFSILETFGHFCKHVYREENSEADYGATEALKGNEFSFRLQQKIESRW